MHQSIRGRLARSLVTTLVVCLTMSVPPFAGQAAAVLALEVTPASHDFGGVPISGSLTKGFVVRNTGTEDMKILVEASGAPFLAQNVNCPRLPDVLRPGETCDVSATFAPMTAGAQSGSMTVWGSATLLAVSTSQVVSLQGVGLASVTLSPSCGPAAPAKTTVTATVSGFSPVGPLGIGPVLFEVFQVFDGIPQYVFRDAQNVPPSGKFKALFGLQQPAGTYHVRATQDNNGNRTADSGEVTASATFAIPCADGSGGDPVPASHAARLYALMTSGFGGEFGTPTSSIEIVGLGAMQHIATFPLGSRDVASLAVSQDGGLAYVADQKNHVVVVMDLTTGIVVAELPVQFPRDVVLSPDGTVLYVTSDRKLLAVDTATRAVVRELTSTVEGTRTDTLLSVAVSPNGQTVATIGHDGSTLWVYIVKASDFTLLRRFALANPGEPTNCATAPNDVAFASDGTLLLWDSNCDALFEVEILTLAQTTAQTNRLGRDDGSSGNYNNALSYSPLTNTAYVHTEGVGVGGQLRGHIGILERAGVTSAGVFGMVDQPFVGALTPNGASLFMHVFQAGADRLDRFDTVTKKYYRGVYQFSESTRFARDMKILPAPLPDLVVTSLDAPEAVQAGGTATYTWTIRNQGTGTANAVLPPAGPPYVWADQMWLSTSPTSIAGAYAAGGRIAQRSLAPGESYTTTFSATVPTVPPGDYYWILQTDSNAQVGEGNETNNLSAAVPVTVPGCTSGPEVTLFDNTNGDGVSNGGTSPSFTTTGAYCITYMQTYHWNDGQGKQPGTLGLTGPVTLGPLAASSSSGQGGAPNVNWFVYPPSGSWIAPAGTYSCVDSDPATWSQNTGSGHKGFCIVRGVPYVSAPVDTAAPTWPAGAALTPFRVGPRLVGFSWPAATDDRAVTAYKILQNGTLRATVGGSALEYRAGLLTPNTLYTFEVQACDAAGNCTANPSIAITTPIGLDNYTWSRAYQLTPGAPVDEHLFLEGLSAWFKFTVTADSEVRVSLSVPADYDLLLFRDIAAAAAPATTLEDIRVANAELLDGALIDGALIDGTLIDGALIDGTLIDGTLIDGTLIDGTLIDGALIDGALIDGALIDGALIDGTLIDRTKVDGALIDGALIDGTLIDGTLIDGTLIDGALIDGALIREANAAAIRRSVLAKSANPGTASERIRWFTFEPGTYYARVRGKQGVYTLAAPFRVQLDVVPGVCESIAPISAPGPLIGGVAGGYKTIVLADIARMAGTPAEKAALEAKLAAYLARPEVGGVAVNVGADVRVAAANAQADANPACSYGKNLAAAEIKRIVDSYRALNPIEDVVIIGPDSAIPFWRELSPEFGTEKDYVPPAKPLSPTDSALRRGLYLSQDRYGATHVLQRLGFSIPVQDIAVSRVLETAQEVSDQLDAYLLLQGGVVALPANPRSLVTGYDFLTDFAGAVRDELQAGTGANAVVDTLIGDTWTTNDLRAKILTQRYDFLSIGGHFSAFSTIGPDYDPATKLRSTEVLSSPVNMEWAIAASPGCHCGFNVPDGDAIANVTPEPDWSQVAARKRFIYVCGTGYQYGETELIEYSERLYLEFAKQLRTGTGPVSTAHALLGAKTAYFAKPLTADIHIKALLEVAHLGLPVRVNMPGTRIGAGGDASIVTGTTPYASGPGADLALSSADSTITFTLTENSTQVRLAGETTDTTATYLSGGSGFLANPFEPVLPLELRNVVVPNTVLRGVGFRGGSYTDTSGVLQLVAVPGTEFGSDMVPVESDVFVPVRFWGANYLAGLDGGPVRLFVTPAQVRAQAPGSPLSIRRQFGDASFRIFYSAHTGAEASAGAHAITGVTSAVDQSGAGFIVSVVGDPRVGTQEVWITYTASAGPLAGTWRSLDLTRASAGPVPGREVWTGALQLPAGQNAGDVEYFVQVANGLGIVSLATNGGRYFRLAPPPQPAATSLALQSPAANTTGAFGGGIAASALLTSGGNPVAGALVTFDLDGQRLRTTTDANGLAALGIPLGRAPGTYQLQASFGGSTGLAPTVSGTVQVTITKQTTTITLEPISAAGQYSDAAAPVMRATLRENSARQLPLAEQTIYWVVTGNDASGTPRYFASADITNDEGQAVLRIDSIPLPAGTYTVTAHFSGTIPHATGPALVLSDERYEPSTATGTLAVSAESATATYTGATLVAVGAALNATATVAQEADATSGDLSNAQVRFDVKDGATVVASATVAVPASGLVSASFAGLAANVYTVEVTVLGGFFAAPATSALIAVYDPSGGFVTGGGWVDSPAGACRLTAVCAGATGRANFGFVSKYQKGASVPTGQTQFQFKAGGVNFHSSSYDWLVVAGARAQFKGSGTINGSGDYGFMLTAIDGQVAGGGGTDKFRIKIWDKASGAVVYDNEVDAADDADPTTALRGGSIVIHKG